MKLANFLVIANKRCGTSWLNHNLATHPDIFMTQKKGVHFFDREFNKGLEHYAAAFAESTEEKRRGETEHSYFWNDEVPGRIHATLGNIPMILSLRQPVERAYSYFQLQKRKQTSLRPIHSAEQGFNGKDSFEEMFNRCLENNYLMTDWGFYGRQLKLYSKYFPIETFHFIKFEEINQKPLQTIQRVFEFLGVHNGFVPPLLMKKWTPATNVAMDMGALKGKILYTSVGARLCRRFFRKVGFSQVKTYNKFSPPPLDPEVKRRLTRVYDDDLKLLMDLSKQDYSSWLSSGQ